MQISFVTFFFSFSILKCILCTFSIFQDQVLPKLLPHLPPGFNLSCHLYVSGQDWAVGFTCYENSDLIAINLPSLLLNNPTIPSEIGLVTSLTYLNMNNNSITSSFPTELLLLKNIVSFTFFGNRITKTIPAFDETHPMLRSLSLGRNLLEGTIPLSLGRTSLTYLDVSLNNLSISSLEQLANVSSLTQISLSANNGSSSTFPFQIFALKLPLLEELYIASCNFVGQIKLSFPSLRILQRLGPNSFGKSF